MVVMTKTSLASRLQRTQQTSGIYVRCRGTNIEVRSKILVKWFSLLLPKSYEVMGYDPETTKIPHNITVGSVPKAVIKGNGTVALLTLSEASFRLTDLEYDNEPFSLLVCELSRIFGKKPSNDSPFSPVWKYISMDRLLAAYPGRSNLFK